MGDHKKTKCRKGHPLEAPNLVFNSEGMRECRICRNKRERDRKRVDYFFERYLGMKRKKKGEK
jgi:hypothetical protein